MHACMLLGERSVWVCMCMYMYNCMCIKLVYACLCEQYAGYSMFVETCLSPMQDFFLVIVLKYIQTLSLPSHTHPSKPYPSPHTLPSKPYPSPHTPLPNPIPPLTPSLPNPFPLLTLSLPSSPSSLAPSHSLPPSLSHTEILR